MIKQNSSRLFLPDFLDKPANVSEGLVTAKLARKKNKVIKLIGSIKKTGYNEYHDYSFVDEAEVVRVLRSALNKAGLSLSVSASEISPTNIIKNEQGESYNYTIKMTITLVDTETGYSESYPWLGMGSDSSDKALYKAYTSGVKYFLLKNFLLPTYDDVERDNVAPVNPEIPPEPEMPPMGKNSSKIMHQLEEDYQQNTPPGARFDTDRFHHAVWAYFKAWPSVNAAAWKVKEVIDIKEVVVWEGSIKC